jgi:pimeloyl-ACP methyl ester carboxylesterase
LLVAACASPAQRLDERAAQLGFSRHSIKGTEFTHVIYRTPSWGRPGTLHVYLEGDGTPFLQRHRVAADPTPRSPLVLELMAQDRNPSVYLGRPCYHGQAREEPCSPALWTTARYGPAVVASMAAALRRLLAHSPYKTIVLIGYSGGGALAILLAEQFSQTRAVVTVAGNLDPARWAAWHGYSPLMGSLNPALRPPLARHIVQLHYAGGQDTNVPPPLIQGAIARQPNATFIIEATFNHACCWRDIWPAVLEALAKAAL